MKKLRVYDIVKELLLKEPVVRNSDKKLIWRVWQVTGFANVEEWGERTYYPATIQYSRFLRAPHPESITRARRKIQEQNPSLRGSDAVERAREEKEMTKGLFIYHENI